MPLGSLGSGELTCAFVREAVALDEGGSLMTGNAERANAASGVGTLATEGAMLLAGSGATDTELG